MNSNKQKNKGFTILIAVIAASILLIISVTIADIAIKEQVLSSAGKDSQIAFYAADTGMECALYWDQKQGVFGTSSPTNAFNCNGAQVKVVDPNTGNPVTPDQIPGNNQPVTFRVDNLSQDGQACALVTITKTVSGTFSGDIIGYMHNAYGDSDVSCPSEGRPDTTPQPIYATSGLQPYWNQTPATSDGCGMSSVEITVPGYTVTAIPFSGAPSSASFDVSNGSSAFYTDNDWVQYIQVTAKSTNNNKIIGYMYGGGPVNPPSNMSDNASCPGPVPIYNISGMQYYFPNANPPGYAGQGCGMSNIYITTSGYSVTVENDGVTDSSPGQYNNFSNDQEIGVRVTSNGGVMAAAPTSTHIAMVYPSANILNGLIANVISIPNVLPLTQCVTGDTKLRRRKKKQNTSAKIEDDEFELVRIDAIEEGDEIVTLNDETGELVVAKVVQLAYMGVEAVIEVSTKTGKQIKTTINHPYLVNVSKNPEAKASKADGAVWKIVSALSVGDTIAVVEGSTIVWDTITSLSKLPEEEVWDIEVEGTHNFVGNSIISHNTAFKNRISIATARTQPETSEGTLILPSTPDTSIGTHDDFQFMIANSSTLSHNHIMLVSGNNYGGGTGTTGGGGVATNTTPISAPVAALRVKTTIDSRGYNTCEPSLTRLERGIEATY